MGVALDVVAEGLVLVVEVEEGVGGVIDDELLGGVVALFAFGLIDEGAAFFEQAIDLGVAVADDVVLLAGVEAGVQPVVRVDGADPADDGGLELAAGEDGVDVGAPLLGFRGDVDADLLELILQHLRRLDLKRVVRPGADLEWETVRVAGLGEQRLGALDVRFGVDVEIGIGPTPVGDRSAVHRLAVAEENDLGHQVAVDRLGDRLPDADVRKGFARAVEHQVVVEGARSGREDDAGFAAERFDVLLWNLVGEVDAGGFDVRGAGGVVGDRGPDQLVEVGETLLVVVRVLDQLRVRAGDELDELEGSGTDGGLREIAVLLDLFLRHDRHRAGELGHQGGKGFAHRDLDGVGGRRLDAGDVDQEIALGRTAGRIFDPVEGVNDVVGGHFAAIVEFHAGAQFEVVDESVVADRPGLGEIGEDVGTFVELDETVVDLLGDEGGGVGRNEVRIEPKDIDLHRGLQRPARYRLLVLKVRDGVRRPRGTNRRGDGRLHGQAADGGGRSGDTGRLQQATARNGRRLLRRGEIGRLGTLVHALLPWRVKRQPNERGRYGVGRIIRSTARVSSAS